MELAKLGESPSKLPTYASNYVGDLSLILSDGGKFSQVDTAILGTGKTEFGDSYVIPSNSTLHGLETDIVQEG